MMRKKYVITFLILCLVGYSVTYAQPFLKHERQEIFYDNTKSKKKKKGAKKK